jgi:hypothetical protein
MVVSLKNQKDILATSVSVARDNQIADLLEAIENVSGAASANIDAKLDLKSDKADTYNKTQVESMLATTAASVATKAPIPKFHWNCPWDH